MKDKLAKIFINMKDVFSKVGWLLLILIPLFVFVNWLVVTIVDSQKDAIETRLSTTAMKDLETLDLYASTQIEGIHEDIHIMLNSAEANDYLMDPTPEHVTAYQDLIHRMAISKSSFVNVMMVDDQGEVLYRVHRLSDETLTVVSGDLGDIRTMSYYSDLSDMMLSQVYLSSLYMKEGVPVFTFVKPLVYDDQLQSYLVIDYEANYILQLLELYTLDDQDYFDIGFLNENNVWHINLASLQLDVVNDETYKTSLFDRIIHNQNIETSYFSFENLHDHFYVEPYNGLRFYILIDLNSAIEHSEAVFIRHAQWIMAGVNITLAILASFLAFMFRVQRDDHLLINANMYLSVQNNDSVTILDKHLRIIYLNPAFEKLFGYHLKESFQKKIMELISVSFLIPTMDGKHLNDYDALTWNLTKSGIFILNRLRMRKETTFAGRDKHFIAIHSDPGIDLEDYKGYVQQKHTVVDELIRLFSHKNIVPYQSTMILIKMGSGDVFACVNYLQKHLGRDYMMVLPSRQHILLFKDVKASIYQRELMAIERLLDTYATLPEVNAQVIGSFVVAQANETLINAKQLIEATLASLSYLKEHPQLKYVIFENDMKQQIERNSLIESQLEQAFNQQEFYLEYQIQKDLIHDRYLGAEALLRWQNETLGQISPLHFIPVIEKSYFINKLTLMVISLAIEDFKNMMDALDQNFRISINLSAFDLTNDYMMDEIIKLIHHSPLATKRFVFELSETVYMNHLNLANIMIDKLHQQNILVAVDDFGTGYSSINLLKSSKADVIKVDRTYIKNYPAEDNGQMLKTYVSLIHRFKKPIMIEGVESKAHIDYCLSNHIEYAQGYYISKPITAELFKERYIKKSRS